MKKAFAKTGNVTRFMTAMQQLQESDEGIPRMALVYGFPGLGKTKTAVHHCLKNDGCFIRIKAAMTPNWLLQETAAELGEAPMRRTSDLFRQVVDQLMSSPRPVFYDEADYLCYDGRAIETLRDIHDMTNAPIILIGMGEADKKLRRYSHLYDRFSEVVKFTDLTLTDIRTIADELCEVRLSDDAVAHIHSRSTKFRRIMVEMYKAEAIAKASGLKELTAQHLITR